MAGESQRAKQTTLLPLVGEKRLRALGEVLSIQAECNQGADLIGRPRVDILSDEEEARVRELIAAGTWPQRWDGTEPLATELVDDGAQGMLWGSLEELAATA